MREAPANFDLKAEIAAYWDGRVRVSIATAAARSPQVRVSVRKHEETPAQPRPW